MTARDFTEHNEEVRKVWDSYRRRKPIRVPMFIGMNSRFTMLMPEINRNGYTFDDIFASPEVMLQRQLEHAEWAAFHLPQDAPMGTPTADGWTVTVELQNVYEAAWFGCPIRFYDDQVPDTEPMLQEERNKNLLFDRGLPDPFTGGIFKYAWKCYDHFQMRKAEGLTRAGAPIGKIAPAGLGTDGPLTVACNLRGCAEFLTDLVEDPDYADRLLDFITTATIRRILAFRRKLGLPERSPSFHFADDSLLMISTDMYVERIMPFHRRMVEALSTGAEDGGIHLCGDATQHFPTLKRLMNIKTFDTGFPVDFGALRRELGPDVEILGGPSVPFLRTATPAQVREEVRRILGTGIMDGGRFVLREGNNLPPGVAIENIQAMYDTVREFGQYPASRAVVEV